MSLPRLAHWTAVACLAGLAVPGLAQAPAGTFTEAVEKAAAAREGRPEEALRWYREAVRLRPSWDEGWWHVGALSYERGDSAAAARAFARFVELKPGAGPGWAMRGLAEFDAARYDAAREHLERALKLETVGNIEIRNAVYFHLAALHLRAGQFELAVAPLTSLALLQPESPPLLAACGLLLLRQAYLPSSVPADKRDVVEAAGRAAWAAMGRKPEARARFDDAIRRFPATPGLHYGYGAYLRQDGSTPAALEEFKLEIGVDANAVYPRLEIAFELMKLGEHAAAIPYAEEATRLAPALFAAHHALGRALLHDGQLERGVGALETAVRLAPEVPEPRAALARAYLQTGRPEDAERERRALENLQARGKARPPGIGREGSERKEPGP